MRKVIKIFTTILAAALVGTLFLLVGCVDGKQKPSERPVEINQWDFINEYIYTWQYNSNPEASGFGTSLPCDDEQISIKDISSHSDLKNWYTISLRTKATKRSIVMTKLSLQIYAEVDCEMEFSLRIGTEDTARARATINASGQQATELLFENFVEYALPGTANSRIDIRLENPTTVGVVKYGFSSLNVTFKENV